MHGGKEGNKQEEEEEENQIQIDSVPSAISVNKGHFEGTVYFRLSCRSEASL